MLAKLMSMYQELKPAPSPEPKPLPSSEELIADMVCSVFATGIGWIETDKLHWHQETGIGVFVHQYEAKWTNATPDIYLYLNVQSIEHWQAMRKKAQHFPLKAASSRRIFDAILTRRRALDDLVKLEACEMLAKRVLAWCDKVQPSRGDAPYYNVSRTP